jgi:transposase
MASLITKWKKGNPYIYWVRSARVNGKPRIVEQVYLGPRAKVMQQIYEHFTADKKEQMPELKRVSVKEFGASALFYSVACELGLIELIDAVVSQPPPAKRTSLSVGAYLVIAAINRAIYPTSKRAISEWYPSSVLSRLVVASKEELSSQRFWDHMDMVELTHIESIQKELLKRTGNLFALDESFLIYDTTNYYTFISTFNSRCSLAQRGRNKQKRSDKRQISLALVTDEQNGFPLYHTCYEGNLTDVMSLVPILASLGVQFSTESPSIEKSKRVCPTIILDKGNVSKENLQAILNSSFSFIVAIPKNWVSNLYNIPLSDFKSLSISDLSAPACAGRCNGGSRSNHFPQAETKRVKVYEAEKTSLEAKLGIKGKVLIAFSPTFYRKQVRTLDLLQKKAEQKLLNLSAAVKKEKRTEKSVKTEIKNILRHDYLKDFCEYNLTTEQGKVVSLTWQWDQKKKVQIKHKNYGKTVLYTNRRDISDARIVKAYRSQAKLEQVFRISKSRRPGLWWPAYHWTDSKIRVHALTCFLALVLIKVVLARLEKDSISISVENLIERLRQIQEAKIIYANGSTQQVIIERTEQQEELFLALKLDHLAKQMGNTLLNP